MSGVHSHVLITGLSFSSAEMSLCDLQPVWDFAHVELQHGYYFLPHTTEPLIKRAEEDWSVG